MSRLHEFGRRLARGAQPVVPKASGRGLTVLAYHLVGAGSDSPVDLPRDLVRRQLDELVEHADVVSLYHGLAALEHGALEHGGFEHGAADDDGRPRVAITFDDAYLNFVTDAWPLLAEHDLPVTLFVPVGFVRGEAPPPNELAVLPAATMRQLLALIADGGRLELGSHSWSHRDLRGLDEAQVDDELRRSQGELEEWTGSPVDCFCYPRGLWDERLEARVAEVYEVATIGGGRRWRPGDETLRVQRVSLRRDGPFSLLPVIRSRIWLEEWLANMARRRRRRS